MNIKEIIKEIKDGFKSGFTKATGYGIDIVYNHELCSSNHIMFAAYVTYVDGTHNIIVDDHYNKMPKVVQQFIIWHELGHIDNEDSTRTLKCESKADAYAVSKIGRTKAMFALNCMWVYACKVQPGACWDIPCRLKELGADVSNMYITLGNGTVLREPELRALLRKGVK